MHATHRHPRHRRRRGIVLVLVLALLALMAVIGVTFATFSGQAMVGARQFAESRVPPLPEDLFDFALSQIVNDSNNPASAIRGHSLLRDMYGNDSVARGASSQFGNRLLKLPNFQNPALNANLANNPLRFLDFRQITAGPLTGFFQYKTNIPTTDTTAGLNLQGWIVRLTGANPGPVAAVAQTFEVLADDFTGTDAFSIQNIGGQNVAMHLLTLSLPDNAAVFTNVTTGSATPLVQPHLGATLNLLATFTLDGRYMRAFNGSGVAASGVASFTTGGPADAGLGNFLYNGVGNLTGPLGFPDAMPMDEDYDACDLENWFLAIQSADGRVVVPSFHRPGVIRYENDPMTGLPILDDWRGPAFASRARILRPRQVDMGPGFPDDPRPDPATGVIEYDVDNDGDGVTDSVWLDLGYPPIRDSSGKLYKPLFAITVLGLNGRLPLNTVGNLAGRGYGTSSPVDNNGDGLPDVFPPYGIGDPTFDHASNVGASASEINPQFAFLAPDVFAGSLTPNFHVDQLRRLLTGDFEIPATVTSPASGPVAGRFGEPGLLDATQSAQPLFPGYRVLPGPSTPLVGGFPDGRRDAQFDANDFFNLVVSGVGSWELSDQPDAAGALSLPVERIRRFLTPSDPLGTGRILGYNRPVPNQDTAAPLYQVGRYDFGGGYDSHGRFSYFHHFRPPGLPPVDADATIPPTAGDLAATPNLLHGFESERNPVDRTASHPLWDRVHSAAMPFNTPTPGAAPTYDLDINSPLLAAAGSYYSRGTTAPYFTGGLNWGDADGVNLYNPGKYDAPFGPADLEWLYRNADVDGSSLDSRLSRLGPFYTDPSGNVRRFFDPNTPHHNRLFSVDVWSTTGFAWAPDNPGGVFPNNNTFASDASASFNLVNTPTPRIAHRDRKINLNFPLPISRDPREPVRLKWIDEAYRLARSVLPPKAVDHPEEVARLGQFIVNIVDFRDIDDVMTIWTNPDVVMEWDPNDSTVAPRAVFANAINPALQQYDLVHYGMEYQPIALNEVLAYWFQRTESSGGPAELRGTPRLWIELANLLTQDGNGLATNASDLRLEDWDIVLTRDTAGQAGWQRPDPVTGQVPPAPATLPADWWRQELELTRDTDRRLYRDNDPGVAPPDGPEKVVPALQENGNYPRDRYQLEKRYFVLGLQAPPAPAAPFDPANPPPNPDPSVTQALEQGNDPANDPDESLPIPDAYLRLPSDRDQPIDLVTLPTITGVNTATPGSVDLPLPIPDVPALGGSPAQTSEYFWVYLRRPANPRAPVQDNPALPDYNPKVVVDSMRFPYLISDIVVESDGAGGFRRNNAASPPNPQEIWSEQRLQPLRGGQAVPNNTTTAEYSPITAYGYSNQTRPASGGDSIWGLFNPAAGAGPNLNRATDQIRQSLGRDNRPEETWDGFPFLDRDFQSVAELLLVPTTPPGLFTKHFVEHNPDVANPNLPTDWKALIATPQFVEWPKKPDGTEATPPTLGVDPDPDEVLTSYETPPGRIPGTQPSPPSPSTTVGQPLNGSGPGATVVPHAYPYLANELFFSADGQDATDNVAPRYLRNTGAGWHKLMAFFEVPTSAFGAISPVAEGHNFDWLRQDTRPGQINLNLIIDEPVFFGLLDDPRMNYAQTAAGAEPRIVTQVDTTIPFGVPTTQPVNPLGSYDMLNAGFAYVDETGLAPAHSGMKAAFRDFLAFRHWNSANTVYPNGFLFGPGPETPYHDLSYPDINFTVMRPANGVNIPGLGNRANQRDDSLFPPPVPPRRLFEVPSLFDHAKNPLLANEVTLFDGTLNAAATPEPRYFLGANKITLPNPSPPPPDTTTSDRRQHPLYRTEMLQKVMNLTTVRTHQYAVWITVGYFEVLRPGNPQVAATNPAGAVDILGGELGQASGRSRRERMFCIIDRTRATGFDPANPGDFRDVIVYRSRIE